MTDPTYENLAKVAIEAARKELELEAEGDSITLLMAQSLFPKGHEKEVWAALKESLDAYAKDGRPTGSFLEAVLANDLKEAFGRADNFNRWFMFPIVKYVYNEMPSICQGSYENVRAWLANKAAERERIDAGT